MPVSAYGRSKACAERIVRPSTIPVRVALRKGTICGLGPNPRLDLALNSMTLATIRRGQVFVDGEGINNRPMLRLSRAVRTYVAAATSDIPGGFHLCNICDDNVTVVGLAEQVCQHTDAKLVHRDYTGRPRSYVMANEGPDGLLDHIDKSPIGIEGMACEVVLEFELCIDTVPQVSAGPRLDRLDLSGSTSR